VERGTDQQGASLSAWAFLITIPGSLGLETFWWASPPPQVLLRVNFFRFV
jgi:hypothetical protein